MKRKLHIAFALLLTARVALAVSPCQYDTVAKINPCRAGREFTIRVPVRLPAGITAQYKWYRNGVAIPNTLGAVGLGGGKIAYTIPAASAWGDNQNFSFLFRLSDDNCADCWDSSPFYEISWNGDLTDFGCVTSGGEIGCAAAQHCADNAGGEIHCAAVQHCADNAGGEISCAAVQHCANNAGGEISCAAAQHCNANSGGVVGVSAVQQCEAGAGGVINR